MAEGVSVTFGTFLREERRKRRWSLRELGEQLRSPRSDGALSPQYLNDLELSRRLPSDDVLEQLASLLKADLSMLRALAQKNPPEVEEYLSDNADLSAQVGEVFRIARQSGFRDWTKIEQMVARSARRKKK